MAKADPSDPKVKAALVRQCLEASKNLRTLSNELASTNDDMTRLFGAVRRAGEDILVECMQMPGVRIAVFPIDVDGKEVK